MLVVKGHGIAKKEKEMIIQNQMEQLFYIFSIHCKFKLTQWAFIRQKPLEW